MYEGEVDRHAGADALGRRPLDRRRRRLDRRHRRGRPAARRPAERGRRSRARPATAAAAPSRRSPTPPSCSGMLGAGELAGGVVARPGAGAGRARAAGGALGMPAPRRSRRASCRSWPRAHGRRDPRDHHRAGRDPRDAALVAFGGAGPLFGHAARARARVATIVVPPHAGNFSAWGLLGADLAQTSSARGSPGSPMACAPRGR